MALTTSEAGQRWSARPVGAATIRAAVFSVPIITSVGCVLLAARVVPPPSSSLVLYLGRWFGLSLLATLILVGVGRLCRRMLPLATLLRLSLHFPDATPSRFRTAIAAGTVSTLEERLAAARRGDGTPAEAAQRLLTLVAALDRHDGLTRGHSERVRAYALVIGQELGLDGDELERLNWAALLHDIGKLEIPHATLNKRGRPTDDEWVAIRRHPELGAPLVEPLRGWLGPWLDAVADHHEHWNGSGYPRGLGGDEISLAGRIIAVADVFDVITSTRSYKSASSLAAGRAELARCAGTQFDPDVVRAFLSASLGRARIASGPLSWLAHASVLARTPLTSAAGTLSAAAVIGVAVAPCAAADRGPGTNPAAGAAARGAAGLTTGAPTHLMPAAAIRSHATGASSEDENAGVAPGRPVAAPRGPAPAVAPSPPGPATGAPVSTAPSARSSPTGSSTVPPTTTTPAPPSTPPSSSTPTLPELPTLPAVPGLPAVPPLPDVSLPTVPPLPSTPTLPEVTSTPSVPDVPALPAAPSTPQIPSAPSLPTVPSLP